MSTALDSSSSTARSSTARRPGLTTRFALHAVAVTLRNIRVTATLLGCCFLHQLALAQSNDSSASHSSSPTQTDNGTKTKSQIDVGQPASSEQATQENLDSALGNASNFQAPSDDFNGSPDLRLAETDASSRGLNFNEFPKSFDRGLTIRNDRWAAKIGGYTKADLIHDFDAIGSRDFFDPTTIEVGTPPRSTSRFHARQTRLNLDSRWITDSGEPLRILIESDFFGDESTLRLRHAYGEYRGLIVGQTWSTFAHRAALPNTLDLVGDVASVGRRQTQIRWTKSWMDKQWSFSSALEDSRVVLDDTLIPFGDARSIAPDVVGRLRYSTDKAQYQLAAVYRRLGFQPTGGEVVDFNGGGLNGTGYVDLIDNTRIYGGILWGSGIGSYRDLPDIAVDTPGSGTSLDSISWYSGIHHQWSQKWSSNFTFSDSRVENTPRQDGAGVQRLQYLATNLIWQPTPYTFTGTEFLWGVRQNKDSEQSDANRLMVSFGFLLP